MAKWSPVSLGQIAAYITRGLQPVYQEDGSIPVLRTVNIREDRFSETRQDFVSSEFYWKNPRGQVRKGDILITSTGVGTLGRVAYHFEDKPYFADGHITIVRGVRGLNPLFVVTFLQSSIGRALIERRQRGSSGQIEIYPADIASILIPQPDEEFQNEVALLQEKAHQLRQKSKSLYAQAEALLLAELGLNDPDLSHQLTYTRNFSEVWAARRLDAEYFQPKYQQAMEIMGQSGKRIGDVAQLVKRRFEPKPGKPFHYIEIGDLDQAGHAESKLVPGEDAPSRAQWIVKAGDVITSTVRPIRRLSALIEPEQDGFVCSSGFAVLRPTNVEPEVLLVYLRLPIVCEILDLHTTASMYPAISTTDLLNVQIPIPPTKIRSKIVNLIQKSQENRRNARLLLEEAKRRVEAMILGEDT